MTVNGSLEREGFTRETHREIYTFDHDHGDRVELHELLGGKGAGLAEMTSGMGLDVPPGFTIALPIARAYRERGWWDELDAALDEHIEHLGEAMGRRFGDPADPLLLAVRSGAPVSMPGMLDTVLNLGLSDESMPGLIRASGDERFAWDNYGRFLHMYATTVMGASAEELHARTDLIDRSDPARRIDEIKQAVRDLTGRDVPQDPSVQLRETVRAVFDSWDCDRAVAYRERENIDGSSGTAVNVQAMVFGNRSDSSGTGVVFTRDPSTGENRLYGDFLTRAQGEDVVSGIAHTHPIAELEQRHPKVHADLVDVLKRLELHYRDVCDVEFTFENDRLYVLQTRVGKRSPVAAVRVAVDLVDDADIALSQSEALERVPQDIRDRARADVLAGAEDGDDADLVTTALGASPGRACGRVVLTPAAALDATEDVILVRKETSPEDVPSMAASVGVLTTRGGLVSHAAVVARGWGIPAVVGAQELELVDGGFKTADGTLLRAGDLITIDGTTGNVWRGEHVKSAIADPDAAINEHLPQLARLEEWAASTTQTEA